METNKEEGKWLSLQTYRMEPAIIVFSQTDMRVPGQKDLAVSI